MFNEGNQIHNFMSSSGSGTVINYGSGSDFLTSYGSGYGSGSTSQKVTVSTVPVPVLQHCVQGYKTKSVKCQSEKKIGIYLTKSSIPVLYGMYTDKNFVTALR